MRDPHVAELRYRIKADPTTIFDSPPPVEDETDEFQIRLDNGIARFRPKDHFATVEEARNEVGRYIRAWEIDVALNRGVQEISFAFENADVIDRDPPPPGSPQVIEARAIASIGLKASATVVVTRRQYPKPPRLFRVSPDVETLWGRYEGYRNGREPLLSMAYFCLTAIERKDGKRGKAAKSLRISRDVLDHLGDLTSTRGDEKTARKLLRRRTPIPLSSQEAHWIEEAIKAIIRRVGEITSDPSPKVITMSDLPSL